MKPLKRKLKRVQPLLGTFVAIELQASAEESSLQTWISAGFEAVKEIDRLMSLYRPDSDVGRLNHAAPGEWVDLSPLTLKVLKVSNALYQISNGVFDIRCATASLTPTLFLQGRGRRVRDGLSVELHRTRARKTGPWQFDLGGIAKGFAVDWAVERIQQLTAGLRVSGSVNAGGDLRVWGRGAFPAATEVRGQGTSWLRPFVVRETAAATSSVRTRVDDNLSPAVHRQMPSAIPLRKEQTVTVFANQCLWADALTKIVLMASEKIARTCLASYHAKALVFKPNGGLQTVLG